MTRSDKPTRTKTAARPADRKATGQPAPLTSTAETQRATCGRSANTADPAERKHGITMSIVTTTEANVGAPAHDTNPSAKPYKHPKSLTDFEEVYRREYQLELESCDHMIAWCEKHNDGYGVNFHQGKRSAAIFNNIKMGQLLRILKKEFPNA